MKSKLTILVGALCLAFSHPGAAKVGFHLATKEEGRALITADDTYISRSTPSDFRLRLGRDNVTAADYKEFASRQVRDFSESDRLAISNAFARLNRRFAALGFKSPLTNEVVLVKTTMREEFRAAGYTRGSAVYLREDLPPNAPDMMLDQFLAHEVFHVLSRQSPEFRRRMYEAIGFSICEEPKFSEEVRAHIANNPDVERYDCKGVFTIDGKPTEATIVTYLPDLNCRPRDFFRKVRPVVVPISQPGRVLRTEEVPDFWKVVGKNTGYVIAAEECVADNFALALMVFDNPEVMSTLPNPEITRKIIAALKGEFKKKPSTAPKRTTLVQMGDVRVGFTIETGEWKPSKNAKTGGGVGSDRALVHASIIPHGQMKSLSVTTNGNVVTAVWKGHPVCGENFTVTAKMTLRPDGGFEYTSFDYAGNESGQYPKRIVFPEVVVPRTKKTALFRPFFAGDILRPNWSKMKTMQRVYSSGLIFKVFNCMAALEEGGVSHFFDQRGDARLHAAAFEATIGSAPNTLVLRNIWLPPVSEETRKAGSLPYPGVYAPYRGGWYEAAKMHRAWMETQSWFKAAAARDFSKLREIDLWMWSRGNIAVSEPPVHWFMKETGLKVALDWYWWHNVPYDTSYPFFWPPRDGEDAFRAAVKRMKDRGAFLQVYTNGMLWDEDDPRWAEGGLESTIVRSNGRIYGTTFNPFTKQSQGHMCGEAPKFHAKMRELEKKLASTGLDGVYMDMISCAAHLPCFNPRHKHAPGDAHALIDGYRDYVNAVHSDNPGFLLSSEATSEAYLDRFESFIMLYSSWERNGLGTMPHVEPVPAVTVIYRGAGVLYGSFATPGGIPGWDPLWGKYPDKPDVEKQIAKYPDQFAVEFARGIVWGVQPMVHNFVMRDVTNPRIAKDIQFMKDSAKFYHDHKEFLFDGEMLKPAKLTCATKRVPFLGTSSYKRPHESKECVQPALPTVFHSEWRAKDGRKAAVLVNWTREAQKYELEFEGKKHVGTIPALSWMLVM